MKVKKARSGIWWKLVATFCVVIAIFCGGYFFLDKSIVPQYFGEYGINNIPDLVGVVTSLYKNPKESEIVTNGYTKTDLTNAIDVLQSANYLIDDDGTITKENMQNFKGDKELILTDRQFAAVCNKLLEDGVLVDALPNLNYLNTMNMTILEVILTPDKNSASGEGFTKGNIKLIAKINTESVKSQIAKQMGTPDFLLDMIIPETLYFNVSYDIDLSGEGVTESNGSIAINGRTEKQSKILINLLIGFIFPEEDEMDISKFTQELGHIVTKGIEALGEFQFASEINGKSNGIIVNPGA